MKTKLPLFILAFGLSLMYWSCDEPETETTSRMQTFLEAMLNTMENNSLNRFNIDWTSFRTQVLDLGKDADSFEEARPAIEKALELLGDNHSFIQAANGTFFYYSTLSCPGDNFLPPTVPDDIGYVRVRSYGGPSDGTGTTFAENIQDEIRNQDSDQLKGWIVDLRRNTGGNMWPMMAGIGPILGNGTAGYFIEPTGEQIPWGYQPGYSFIRSSTVSSIADPYVIINQNPKVAVLTDQAVASSGEAVATAFQSRPDTRFFGKPTCGLSTSNRSFNLPNAQLILTVSIFADRDLNEFGDSIEPDELITDSDELITRAIEWLKE